jgi:hypothetical protein
MGGPAAGVLELLTEVGEEPVVGVLLRRREQAGVVVDVNEDHQFAEGVHTRVVYTANESVLGDPVVEPEYCSRRAAMESRSWSFSNQLSRSRREQKNQKNSRKKIP